jgi:hypothetical protein
MDGMLLPMRKPNKHGLFALARKYAVCSYENICCEPCVSKLLSSFDQYIALENSAMLEFDKHRTMKSLTRTWMTQKVSAQNC